MQNQLMHWSDALPAAACADAAAWCRTQPDATTAWANCERGDWMLWLLGRQAGKPGSVTHKRLVLAACGCARLALPHVSAGENRPRLAIETAEQWARGDAGVTLDDVRDAAAARADARAYAAADAAAWAAAVAAARAAAVADRSRTLRECADIVRRHYPEPPLLEDAP